jgi:hypothetical protein
VRLAERVVRQAWKQVMQRVVAQAHRSPEDRQGRGRRNIDAVEILEVTLMGSPSFSHRCATRVRTWFRNITPEATPRKIRKSRSGMAPIAVKARRVIAQRLAAALLPCPVAREFALG